jgi:hypothetical protein
MCMVVRLGSEHHYVVVSQYVWTAA